MPAQRWGPFRKDRAFAALVGVAVLAAAGYGIYSHFKPEKAKPSPTRAQIAQNKCAEGVFLSYIKGQGALAKQASDLMSKFQPTTEITIAKRRLQEDFCQQFVACISKPNPRPTAALEASLSFEKCVMDEEKQEVDEDREMDAQQDQDDPSK